MLELVLQAGRPRSRSRDRPRFVGNFDYEDENEDEEDARLFALGFGQCALKMRSEFQLVSFDSLLFQAEINDGGLGERKCMKALFAVVVLLAVASVRSQTPAPGDSMQDEFVRQNMARSPNESLLGLQPVRANEVRVNGVTYSGILVLLSKTGNPLQLINPAAPPAYGSPEDNVARDPITGGVSGLRLFSISF